MSKRTIDTAGAVTSNSRRSRQRLAIAAGLAAFGAAMEFGVSTARAQDISWNTVNAGSWNTASNWTGPGVPGTLTGAGLFVRIGNNITADRIIALDGNKTVGRLDIGDGATTSNEFIIGVGTVAGSVLIFDSGSSTVAAQLNQLSTSNGDSITAGVLLNSSLNINNQATNTARIFSFFGAPVSANTGTAMTITNLGNAGGVTFSGVVSDGTVAGGSLAIVQSATVATSVLTLSNSASIQNTFTGGVTVNNGIVAATTTDTTTNTLRSLGTGTVNLNGGTLQLRANGTGSNATIITGNGTTGNNVVATGVNTVDVNRTSGANTGSAIVINNLSIAGGSTLNVTGGNTYRLLVAGATSVGGNVNFSVTTAPLTLSSLAPDNGVAPGTTAWATFNGSGATTMSALTNNSGDSTKKLGLNVTAGTVSLTTANSFDGGVSLSGGTLNFVNNALSSNVVNVSGGTLQWAAGNNADIGSAVINSLSGTTTLDNGANNVTLAGANALTGTGTLTKLAASAGTLSLNAANSFSGVYNTSTTGGVTTLNNANALQNATVNIGGANKLLFGSGVGTFTLGALTGSSDLTLVDTGATAITLQLQGTTGGATYSGKFGTNTASLVKIGTGTQILSGANTYSGGTLIKSGSLFGGSTTATAFGTGGITLGDSSGSANATLGGAGTTYANALTIASGSSGTLSLTNNGNISAVFGGAVALNHDLVMAPTGTGSVRLGGAITGSNNIIVSGDAGATAALSGSNTLYSGTTSLSSGTLSLQNNNALGVGGALVINGGALSTSGIITISSIPLTSTASFGFTSTVNNTLLFAGGPVTFGTGAPVTVSVTASTLTFSGTSSGSLVKDGAGTLRLWGTNGIAGFTVAAGTLILGKPVLPSNFQVASGATLGLNLGGSGEFTGSDLTALDGNAGFASGSSLGADTSNASAPVTVTGALTAAGMGFSKTGPGTLVLTADHSYGGGTTVTTGTLQLGAGAASGSVAGAVGIGSGTQLTYNRSGSVSVGNLFNGAGSVNFTGPGTFTLTNAGNSFTGGIGIYNSATYSISAGGGTLSGTIALGGIGNPSGVPSNEGAGNLVITATDFTASRFNVTSESGTNTVTIGAGRTFTVQNTVSSSAQFIIGTSNGPSGATLIDFVGGGNLVINTPLARVDFGLQTQILGSGSPGFNDTDTDLTGLNNFTSTSALFNIGNAGQNSDHLLLLASGANDINATNINVGGGKGQATLRFDAANTTGTLKVRGLNGVDAVTNFLIGPTPALSGGTGLHTVNFNGHVVDISTTTLTMSNHATSNTNSVNTSLSFNAGTIGATALVMSQKLGSSNTNATSAITIGGTGLLNVGTGGIALGSVTTAGTANARLNILGGTINTDGDILDGGGNNTSSITLSGGTLNLMGHNIGNATNSVDNLALLGGTLSSVGQINNGANISKTSAGTLTLTGTNTYTGATGVAAGAFRINGTATTAVNVSAAGTLGGSGLTTGAATIDGTLAPGNSVGTLTVGGLTMNSGSKYSVEVDKTNVLADSVVVSSGGSVSLGAGNATLDLVFSDEITTPFNHTFFLLVNNTGAALDASTNYFANSATNISPTEFEFNNGALAYVINYNANYGGAGNDGLANDVSITFSSVPEPASLSLLALGGLGLLKRRRRSK